MDQDAEKHFKDVTAGTEPLIDVFVRFLAAVRFLNGYDTMKRLSIGSRIKWMKICSLIWHVKDSKINDFQFEVDNQEAGITLARCLQTVDEMLLNRYLARVDAGTSLNLTLDFNFSDGQISAFGSVFFKTNNQVLQISLAENPACRKNN